MRSDKFYYVGGNQPRWYGPSKRPVKPRKNEITKSFRKKSLTIDEISAAIYEFSLTHGVSPKIVLVQGRWDNLNMRVVVEESQASFLQYQKDWDEARERFKGHVKTYNAKKKRQAEAKLAQSQFNQLSTSVSHGGDFVIVRMSTADYNKLKKL